MREGVSPSCLTIKWLIKPRNNVLHWRININQRMYSQRNIDMYVIVVGSPYPPLSLLILEVSIECGSSLSLSVYSRSQLFRSEIMERESTPE